MFQPKNWYEYSSSDEEVYIPACKYCKAEYPKHTFECQENHEYWPASNYCVCGAREMTKDNSICPACGRNMDIVICPICAEKTFKFHYDEKGCARKFNHPDAVAQREEEKRIELEKKELRVKKFLNNEYYDILEVEVEPMTQGDFNNILEDWARGGWRDYEAQKMVGKLLRLICLKEESIPGDNTINSIHETDESSDDY